MRVGTAGNLRDLKRIDYLINAVSEIKNPFLQCYIIGNGPSLTELKNLVNLLNLGERIKFLGRKEDITNYLQILDIFVLPSNESESFGNAAVEAMAMGIPTIVMYDGGGLLEHIPMGLNCIAKDILNLASIIAELAESAELRNFVGNSQKEYVRSKYTLSNMVNSYIKFYSNCIWK